MKLSASNIGWIKENDEKIYEIMEKKSFSGVEIAPTRWFSDNPYEKIKEAKAYAKKIKSEYGLSVSSMQSIWYGKTEKIAQSAENRKMLLDYTEKALIFAEAAECQNLVFGCPKNRATENTEQIQTVTDFLYDTAKIAEKYNAVIALEPNPPIYNTNYANTTKEAVDIIKAINSPSLKLNVDFGTIIENKECLDVIENNIALVHHVHISEPKLLPIEAREEHKKLKKILEDKNYEGYVSLEMGLSDEKVFLNSMEYLCEVFG